MNQKQTMKKIGGYACQKDEAHKVIDFFKNFKLYTENGAVLPRGFLFYGSPGNGKTLFANAIATDSGVPVFSLSDRLYVQESSSITNELNKLFKNAKENAPSIILIDEIDQLVEVKEFGTRRTDSEKEILRTLLTEIDKLGDSGVLIIATCNCHIEQLPGALVRDGRLEKHVQIANPDFEDRESVINIYLKESEIFNDINASEIAKLTQGFTCSSLKTLVNDVLIKCLSKKIERARYKDFNEPIQVILTHGVKRKSSPKNDHIIYHEIGHVITDYVLNKRIGFASIESSGNATALYRPERSFLKNEQDYENRNDIEDPMTVQEFDNKSVVSIAGLVATEVYLGQKYVGSAADLATIKYNYEQMCLNGLLSIEEYVSTIPNFGEDLCLENEFMTNRIKFTNYIKKCYNEAFDILKKHKELADKLYKALKTQRTLTSEEIALIIMEVENKNK